MSTFTYQTLKDSNKVSIIKLTGTFTDSTQENNSSRITANGLFGALDSNNVILIAGGVAKPYYGLSVYRVWYDINLPSPGYIRLFWNGTTASTILNMSNPGEYNVAGNWVSIQNNATGTVSGDIGLTSVGATNNSSYTIIVELHKDNQYYNAGQLTEPSAFNYGAFGIKP